ncbi:hypothetical protein Tco_1198985 [Tanacetum coccineum]
MCRWNIIDEGNDNIEAIKIGHNIHRARFIMFISKMKKLSWLRLNMVNAENVEAPNLLSNELRYIDWSYYRVSSYQFLPQKFRFSTYPSKHGILSKVGFVWHSEIRSALINWRTLFPKCGFKRPEKTPLPLRLRLCLRMLDLTLSATAVSKMEKYSKEQMWVSSSRKLVQRLLWIPDLGCSGRHVDNRCSPNITIKEEASDEMRDSMLHDVVWMESFGGKRTWVNGPIREHECNESFNLGRPPALS